MAETSYTFRQGDLPKLDLQIDRGTEFTAWRTQWNSYSSLSGLVNEDATKQVKALTLCLSRETLAIVHNLGLSEEQMKRPDAVIQAMQEYIDGHVNETVERRNFRSRRQLPGESFDDFLIALRELVKTCKFCSEQCAQKNLRDQVVEGLRDIETVEDLLKENNLTLDNAIAKCRSREAARKHCSGMTRQEPEAMAALQITQRGRTKATVGQGICSGCGGAWHKGGRQQCPAYDRTCARCQKRGHFAKVCRSKTTQQGPAQASANAIHVDPQQNSQEQVRMYAMNQTRREPAPTIEVQMTSSTGKKNITVLPDSGAEITAAGKDILKYLDHHPHNLLPSTIAPRTVNGSSMSPIGRIPITIHLEGKQCTDDLHVIPGIKGCVISWQASKCLGILPAHYPNPTKAEPNITMIATDQRGIPTAQEVWEEFPSVFDGQVRVMDGEQFHITLTENAVPFCVKTPRTVPFAYREKLKAELELLQQQGIIAPVTEATQWCAPIVVTPKKGTDRIRMCVDLSKLNRFVLRERYQSPTPAEAVADITASEAKYFTVMDATKGYHQCPLAEDSQELTTFITPFGRFKYLRAPYGLSSIAEHYNRRMAEALEGLSGYRRIVDDIVIYDKDPQQHVQHVKQFLERCRDRKISINRDKWQFCQSQVKFAGFHLMPEGYQVDPSITAAITLFPSPTTRTELRSFVGLVNQLTSGTNTIAELITPFRPLLSTKNEFMWTTEHDQALTKVKECLTTTPVLAFFDVTKATRICTDASRQGLGFIMQQQTAEGQWHLIQAGSRCLTDAEARYAVIELELLAVTWAIWKCRVFLMGMQHFDVITDHNPLISILNHHRLDEIDNPRLQRLRAKIMAFNFKAVWHKGVTNQAPDALSRNPVSTPSPAELLAEHDEENNQEPSAAEIRAIHRDGLESIRIQELRRYAEADDSYQKLKSYVMKGFPDHRHSLHECCKRYWQARQHLSIDDGLLTHGCRLVIPSQMRSSILSQLHEAHQGSTRTKQRAHLTVYWPGMDNDIDNMVYACKQCQDCLPSQPKEPIRLKPQPQRPFQEVAADFCYHAGKSYLIIVDCYSDWPTIIPMGRNTTTSQLEAGLRELFSRTAVPDIFWSDNGPQFTSKEFRSFARQWGFHHQTSTPYYPQSNGRAEAAVKSMKRIIRAAWNGRYMNEDKLCRALLQYRNTPSRKDGLSPAQKLYGNPIQDTLPAHYSSFAPEWQHSAQEAKQQAEATREASQRYYNTGAHPLPEIRVGTNVAVQDHRTRLWDTYGVVIAIGPQRQYHVKTQKGSILVRNRRFIRRRVPGSITYLQCDAQCTGDLEATHQCTSEPRRSHRGRKPTQRLIEDPNWN